MSEMFQPGTWSVDMEVNLFHSMRSHKPVGVNRHFHMVIIHDKLTSPTTKKLTAKDVWDHLATMYDLQALNESEILPFPNKPVDFKLPGNEYTQLCEAEFPRMHNVGSTPTSSLEETKTKHEGQAKGGKVSRSDTKTSDVRKSDSKSNSQSEHKSTHSSKIDSKSSSVPSGRGEGKGGGKVGGQSSSSYSASSTPVPSPKRTKRTRHNQSATSSPACDAPSSKRRRC